MLEKVLILSASAGAGHVRAAEALERAFAIVGGAKEVRHVDALDYTTRVFRNLYHKAYIDIVNAAPEVVGWLYDQYDQPWNNKGLRTALSKLNTRPLMRMLEHYQPDVAVCTHFLPAEIIAHLREKERLRCPVALTVTDFDVHAMWLCRPIEQYFVALEEACHYLEQLGIPAGTVHVTGIPIDPVFGQPKDRRAMRLKHGLDPERTTILVSTGGCGVGPMGKLMAALLQLKHPLQIVAICGRNEELRERLQKQLREATTAKHLKFHVIGFTKEMDEYMAAADLLLGKPGGLTMSEALARGLAMVVVNPIPGQEERNADHLLEEGAAIRCNNLPTLAYKIDRLLDDPLRLATMQANARRLARPEAALDVVRTVMTIRG